MNDCVTCEFDKLIFILNQFFKIDNDDVVKNAENYSRQHRLLQSLRDSKWSQVVAEVTEQGKEK